MKVFHETKARYIGTAEVFGLQYHMFQKLQEYEDPELVLVTRARVLKEDGTSVYYDEIEKSTP